MAANLTLDPGSGLLLPRQFVDQKVALKKVVDELIEKTVNSLQHIKETYFLVLHARFSKHNSEEFTISQPVATFKLPPFVTNQMVFWVNNAKGICEMLWMVTKKNGKIKVDFNTSGVAYLQAKGAMPSKA